MSAYNRLNGTYASESSWLLNKVLREDWGFEGLVVSDWGGTNSRAAGIAAGGDLEMPASGGVNDRRVLQALEDGKLHVADLDAAVTRVVSLILAGKHHTPSTFETGQSADEELLADNHAFARRAAIESAVLLQNINGVLPLRLPLAVAPLGIGDLVDCKGTTSRGEARSVVVIGSMAKAPRFQGAGSSRINASTVDVPFEAIQAAVEGSGGSVTYCEGYDEKAGEDDDEVAAAVEAARTADAAILFVGLQSQGEAEGAQDAQHAVKAKNEDRGHDRLLAQETDRAEGSKNTLRHRRRLGRRAER